jgi:DNA-binding LacI/PurR family transcriptional regulator
MHRLATRLPVVSLLRPVRNRAVGVVRTDDALGLRLAVTHLRSLGHHRIAWLDGGRAAGATERRQGYRRAMRAVPPAATEEVLDGGLTELDGARAADQFLSLTNRPTAVAAFNDRCALGFIDVVRQHGVRVPEDVSVVGFDDIAQAAYPHVALTTIRQDAARLGAAAVRSVIARLDGRSADPTTILTPELVIRTSTAPRR